MPNRLDGLEAELTRLAAEDGVSDAFEVFPVDEESRCTVHGIERRIGGAFQPSVLVDDRGYIHVFFQVRLDTSEDQTAKMIGHVQSQDGGRTYSDLRFVGPTPMQTYAAAPFLRESPTGGKRISLLTCLSIDETIERLKEPELIIKSVGVDTTTLTRKAGSLVIEFYSDDRGETWKRRDHPCICDRVYQRNGRDFYLAFMNMIGQVRRIEEGPYNGRLIIGGPVNGDYLPCEDHPHFRDYSSSSSLIYSDDGGESWTFGGVLSDDGAFDCNEASAVPVNGGCQILLACRSNDPAPGKTMRWSNDGGDTWEPGFVTAVPATRCLQVLENGGDVILCSAPGMNKRTHGTIYSSRDGGKSWAARVIEEGPFSYSTVNRLTGDYFMCCFSRGHHGESGLAARVFHRKWLEESASIG